MSTPPYVPISPSRLGLMKKLQLASYLHDFLVQHQTDAHGHVNYGRPFGYAWIRARWPGNPDDRPCVRVLKKYMARLKQCGLVHVRTVRNLGGMTVRLLHSVKWPAAVPERAVQLPLYSPPPTPIRREEVQDSVDKQGKSTGKKICLGHERAPSRGTSVPRKEVKNKEKETIRSVALAHAVPTVEKSQRELDARRRLLLDQADALKRKYKSAG